MSETKVSKNEFPPDGSPAVVVLARPVLVAPVHVRYRVQAKQEVRKRLQQVSINEQHETPGASRVWLDEAGEHSRSVTVVKQPAR